MKILVTGSRAPASLDIIHSLINQGHDVFSADSMTFPLGRFVKGLKKHFTLPKPNRKLANFFNILKEIIINYQIQIIIPTCEEIFFISQYYDELSKYTRLFCETFSRLNSLHNKHEFNKLVADYGLNAPKSWLLITEEDKKKIPNNQEIILKPIFSRFGSNLIIKPTLKAIEELPLSVPYLAQQFLKGKEYCAYAIANKGKVLISSCYHSKYTAGPAAGIYFEPAEIESINKFVITFCNKYQYSGQIAFDFIVIGDSAFVLECNPRTTSGFHLIAEQINWTEVLKGKQQKYHVPKQIFMLGLAMRLYGLNYFRKNPKLFIKDYRNAQDVLFTKTYSWFGINIIITLLNIFIRMIKYNKNFHRASTDDIEFNGLTVNNNKK